MLTVVALILSLIFFIYITLNVHKYIDHVDKKVKKHFEPVEHYLYYVEQSIDYFEKEKQNNL